MKLLPLQDQVLVELDPFEKNFGDGPIVRPDIARDKPIWGVVKGVGPGKYDKKGRFIPTTVKLDQRVSIPWATGHDLSIEGQLYVFIRERDILAVEN